MSCAFHAVLLRKMLVNCYFIFQIKFANIRKSFILRKKKTIDYYELFTNGNVLFFPNIYFEMLDQAINYRFSYEHKVFSITLWLMLSKLTAENYKGKFWSYILYY